MFSMSAFRQVGMIGGPITTRFTAVPVFAGSPVVDPASGVPLSSLLFDYNSFINGQAGTLTGIEMNSKTAFTFLPWRLRYTGLDANFSRQHPLGVSNVDLFTGQGIPPIGQANYSYNLALWYDDGKLAARVAVQTVGSKPNGQGGGGYYAAIGSNGITAGVPNYSIIEQRWRQRTSYIDAKISYKFSPHFDVFAEGRNLGQAAAVQNNIGNFSDGTPWIDGYTYGGRRITVGMNFRN
jgi:hypothetical protein